MEDGRCCVVEGSALLIRAGLRSAFSINFGAEHGMLREEKTSCEASGRLSVGEAVNDCGDLRKLQHSVVAPVPLRLVMKAGCRCVINHRLSFLSEAVQGC